MQPPTDAGFAASQAASRERSNRVRFEEKQRRKNAPRACVICAARKVSCDVNRPCLRCVKAGKEHLCVDVETKRKRKPSHEDLEGDEFAGNMSSPPGLAVTTRASARQLEATTRQGEVHGGGVLLRASPVFVVIAAGAAIPWRCGCGCMLIYMVLRVAHLVPWRQMG
jgi:hypothetical protein